MIPKTLGRQSDRLASGFVDQLELRVPASIQVKRGRVTIHHRGNRVQPGLYEITEQGVKAKRLPPSAPGEASVIPTLVLIAVVSCAVATWFDWHQYRIPNVVVSPMAVVGVAQSVGYGHWFTLRFALMLLAEILNQCRKVEKRVKLNPTLTTRNICPSFFTHGNCLSTPGLTPVVWTILSDDWRLLLTFGQPTSS